MSATWDTSGDPCPIKTAEVAIKRFDGLEIMPFQEISAGNFKNYVWMIY
jgi:hypothetical protein